MRVRASVPRNPFGFPFLLLGLAMTAFAGIKVDVEGNAFFGDRKIKEVLPVDPQKFTEEDINTWREDAVFSASDLYLRHGFFEVKVEVAMEKGEGPEDWKAQVKIADGPRYVFDTVRVVVVEDTAEVPQKDSASVGVDTASVDTLKVAPPQSVPQAALVIGPKELDARVGKPYVEELLFRDRRTVLRKYGDAGFVRAQVDDKVVVKPESKTVKVDYLVEPSVPVIYDTLFIHDQRAPPADSLAGITRHSLLLSLVPYKRGDTVRVSSNDRLIEKLQYTGVFNYVRLKDSLLPGPQGRSALVLYAEEQVPGNLRTSVFWENQYGPGVSFEAAHNNLAGVLNQVRGGASVAKERQRLHAGYGSPLTLGYLVRFDDDFDVNWFQADSAVNAYGMFGGDFQAVNSTRLTWPWSYWLRLSTDARFESRSRRISSGRERSLNLNFVQTAALSFLNQPMDPSRGARASLSWGNGGVFLEDQELRFLQSRHNWLEAQTGYYYYYPPLRQAKLAARLDGGRFFREGGANNERFFLGGSRSVRSYGFQRLCPNVDSAGICSTTDLEPAYFQVSGEVRLALFDFSFLNPRSAARHLVPLEIVPFYDFGKVWDVREKFSLTPDSGQGRAYGVGLRYPLLGIFNFRLDVAYGNLEPGRLFWLGRRKKYPDSWVIDLAQAF